MSVGCLVLSHFGILDQPVRVIQQGLEGRALDYTDREHFLEGRVRRNTCVQDYFTAVQQEDKAQGMESIQMHPL